jgi:hypothetical protein
MSTAPSIDKGSLWRLAASNGEIVSEPEKAPEPRHDPNSWEALDLRLTEVYDPIEGELFDRLDGLSDKDRLAIITALLKMLVGGARAASTNFLESLEFLGVISVKTEPWGIEAPDYWAAEYGGTSKSKDAEGGGE